jgi:hypothetical protein
MRILRMQARPPMMFWANVIPSNVFKLATSYEFTKAGGPERSMIASDTTRGPPREWEAAKNFQQRTILASRGRESGVSLQVYDPLKTANPGLTSRGWPLQCAVEIRGSQQTIFSQLVRFMELQL